jgi:hypothetical protein
VLLLRALFKSPLSARVLWLIIDKLDKPVYTCFKPFVFIKEPGLNKDLLLIRWIAL